MNNSVQSNIFFRAPCFKAKRKTHVLGKKDNRGFCCGIVNDSTGCLYKECKDCKAYISYAFIPNKDNIELFINAKDELEKERKKIIIKMLEFNSNNNDMKELFVNLDRLDYKILNIKKLIDLCGV